MPDIMSAEELSAWLMVRESNHTAIAARSIEERIRMIKSRDSTILEKYKKAIVNKYGTHIDDFYNDALDDAIAALDLAFAEIEGGENEEVFQRVCLLYFYGSNVRDV